MHMTADSMFSSEKKKKGGTPDELSQESFFFNITSNIVLYESQYICTLRYRQAFIQNIINDVIHKAYTMS